MNNEILNELIAKKIIPSDDVFDFSGSPFYEEFKDILDFYQKNLLINSTKYDIHPCVIYIKNQFGINARAAKIQDYFIISINMGAIKHLIDVFLMNKELINEESLKEYQELESFLDVPIHVLMHHGAIHFSFYHEMAHLIQKSDYLTLSIYEDADHDSQFFITRHLLEIDADEFSAINVVAHVVDHAEDTFGDNLNESIMQNLIVVLCSSLLLYFLSFQSYKNEPEIYTTKSTHPHPCIRIAWIVITIIDYVNQDLKGRGYDFTLDRKKIGEAMLTFSELIGVKIFGDSTISYFRKLMEENAELISIYLHKISMLKHNDKSMAVSKWNYLAGEYLKKKGAEDEE
ncbi:hypothetical protein [Haliscomenobacter hydrossis]|uniref:Uncharacterized protein n=1 Tax=Haliscomenobacter hydrossis (strain ATCC 27775 / DSM 1100 / LMG 10767 / O) TaxID=760192 RepID=F4KV03_HALH1|nr:hypothetical protein [Haliscomenobacter hydrossis]AEE48179.1 hypothetical protein Halhy_0267 [Haliscomenobacter hydrossis DSM 1100]